MRYSELLLPGRFPSSGDSGVISYFQLTGAIRQKKQIIIFIKSNIYNYKKYKLLIFRREFWVKLKKIDFQLKKLFPYYQGMGDTIIGQQLFIKKLFKLNIWFPYIKEKSSLRRYTQAVLFTLKIDIVNSLPFQARLRNLNSIRKSESITTFWDTFNKNSKVEVLNQKCL